jgi:hypothetical protein
MVSLLLLSLALTAPAAKAPAAAVAQGSLVVEPAPLMPIHHGMPEQMLEEQQTSPRFDAMEIHPESDICFKIRAYIFSQGSHPKLLRETTCGPKAPAAKQVDGFKPRLVPLDVKDEPAPVK